APRVAPTALIAHPHVPNTKTGDEPHVAIDRQHFAMIPMQPAERTCELRCVEAAHIDPRVAQALPKMAGGLAEVPQPVIAQPHRDSSTRPLTQSVGELPADVILDDEIVFEVNRALR